MGLDHNAIWKAYEGVVVEIHDATGAFDKDGNQITLDQSKIDLNIVDKFGWTALHYACNSGNTELVEMMIENAESSKLDFKVKTKF